MKRIIKIPICTFAVLFSLIGALQFCRADLGDTYAQSCQKFGGPGRVNKTEHYIWWHIGKATYVERFVKNECVFLRLIPDGKLAYTVEDVERILPWEAGGKQAWIPLAADPADTEHLASWATDDGLVLAGLFTNGTCQFTYRWFIEAKGHLESALPPAAAPVEDDPSSKQL